MSLELVFNVSGNADKKTIELQKQLAKLNPRISETDKAFAKSSKTVGLFDRQVNALSSDLGSLVTGYIALNGVMSATSGLIRNADAMTNVNSKLKLVTESTEELAKVQEDLFKISQKTRSEFDTNVDLYQKISFSTKELNLTQKEQLSLTEQINKELLISGTTADGASTLITQLGQAFSSNFQAISQELGTIRDQAPSLYQTLLAGTQMTTAEFKKAAEEGELSSKIIIDAIKNQASETDKNFAQIATIINKAYGNIENSAEKVIGKFDKLTGASQSVSDSMIDFAEFLDENSDSIVNMSQVIGITAVSMGGLTLATKSYQGILALTTITTTSYNVATNLATTSTARMTTAQIAGAVSSRALGLALKAIPFVAIAGSIALIADAWINADKAQKAYDDTVKKNSLGFTGLGILEDKKFETMTKDLLKAFDTMEDLEGAYLETRGSQNADYYETLYNNAVDNYKKIEKVAIETSNRIFGEIEERASVVTVKKIIIETEHRTKLSEAGTKFADENARKLISNEKSLKQIRIDNAQTLSQLQFDLIAEKWDEEEDRALKLIDLESSLQQRADEQWRESELEDAKKASREFGNLVGKNLEQEIQSSLSNVRDFDDFANALGSAVESALSSAVATSLTTSLESSIGGIGSSLLGGIGGSLAGMAVSTLAGVLFGGDNGQSESELAEERFDGFMDSIEDASKALEAFGNVGSSLGTKVSSLQKQAVRYSNIQDEATDFTRHTDTEYRYTGDLDIKHTGGKEGSYITTVDGKVFSGSTKRNLMYKVNEYATSLLTNIEKELTSIVEDSLSDTLDISALTTEQIGDLVSGVDVEAMRELDTELNNIALSMKLGTESAQDITRATEILSDIEFAKYQDLEEAIGIAEDAREKEAKALKEEMDNAQKIADNFRNTMSLMTDSIDSAINSIKGNMFTQDELTTDQIKRLNETQHVFEAMVASGDTKNAKEALSEITSLTSSISAGAFGDTSKINQNLITQLEANKAMIDITDEVLMVHIVASDLDTTATTTTTPAPSVYVTNQTNSNDRLATLEAIMIEVLKTNKNLYSIMLDIQANGIKTI